MGYIYIHYRYCRYISDMINFLICMSSFRRKKNYKVLNFSIFFFFVELSFSNFNVIT